MAKPFHQAPPMANEESPSIRPATPREHGSTSSGHGGEEKRSKSPHVERTSSDLSNMTDPEAAKEDPSRLVDYAGACAKTDPKEFKLVAKLDRRFMPILFLMYYLNYIDRSAIASARLNGLQQHLGVTGPQYQSCISILFVGYVAIQTPSNMLMCSSKVRPATYMGLCMAIWAVVSFCTAFVKNYIGLLLVRLLLGIAEAPFFPGALYMLSSWYTRKELATRIAFLYIGNLIAMASSGLIAAAIFSTIDGSRGFYGWQWLFIIEGVMTFVVALSSTYILPNFPHNTSWLTKEEQELATKRIERDTVGLAPSKGVKEGVRQCLKDPKIYVLCLMQNLHISACSFNNFFPTVINSLGFSPTKSLLLTSPPYLFAAIVSIAIAIHSGKRNERTWHITFCMFTAIAGFLILAITENSAARYFGTFLFVPGAYAPNPLILGWVSATLGQTTEKKAIAMGVVNTLANLSYVYTPYLYKESDAPKHVIAMSASTGFAAGCVACAWILWFWLRQLNRKRREYNSSHPGEKNQALYAY